MLEVTVGGITQLNAEMSVYTLKQKTNVSAGANAGETYWPFTGNVYTLTVSSAMAPFVAWGRNTDGTTSSLSLVSTTVSGSTWTYIFLGLPSKTVTFYVFDFNSSAVTTPSNFGLQLFDPFSTMVYDAIAGRAMRRISMNTVGPMDSAGSVSVPAGKLYAGGIMVMGGAAQNTSASNFTVYSPSVSVSSTAVSFGHSVSFHEDFSLSDYYKNSVFAVIDVTAY